MHVLLTGASGFIGSQLLPRLHREGHELRALARDPTALQIPSAWGVEVVRGDVVSGEGLARALAGVE
ncbi:MAG: SDR family oxidoreductase, partial [Solirubrobacterales bacterium]